ncbi:hypothetical protein [Micromonospora sp. NPDC000018]|uniref:hypothetical protein n=1 Tax=Micromonospora sp. NPDC000018 TaxID=3154239 RepID=UPI00331E2EF1
MPGYEPAARTQKGRNESSCPAGSMAVTSDHGEVTGVRAGCLNHRYERVTPSSVPDGPGRSTRSSGNPRRTFTSIDATGGSSIDTGPAFSPDGTRLYFSSQRGTSGSSSGGITYEVRGPFRF